MSGCFHGGAFWDAIPLRDRKKGADVINADVLDAWFPPAPAVVEALRDDWLYRTSPPTHAEEMEKAIAKRFSVPAETVMAGPGSSSLMFAAFNRWLSSASRVLLIEPTYGEYAHLCESVIGCRVDRFPAPLGGRFDLEGWSEAAEEYDLAVLVNPNNPTGELISTARLAQALPKRPRVWVDEAYLAYTNEPSLAQTAVPGTNVSVVRTFSKSHALSGLRSAALFSHPETIAALRPFTPPWWVSLPAQVATVVALSEEAYYRERYAQTEALRDTMACALGLRGDGAANWLLAALPKGGPTASEIVQACAERGVYLRDVGKTAASLGDRMIRIAVKPEWRRIVEAIYATTSAVKNPSYPLMPTI